MAEEVADWIVYTSQEDPPTAPQDAIDLHGDIYRAVSLHHAAAVSGSHWAVYRRVASPSQK